MSTKTFTKKPKEEKPVLAICYDFDRTLSPDDMQAQGYIQSVGYDVESFWKESNALAENNEMDQNLAYMYKMVEESEGRLWMTKEKLAEYGARVSLFPGVIDWFERIRLYGVERDVIVEHYIISSGLKEMIEGTLMAKNGAFERIYASSFYFNHRGVAKWPAQVINYTNKTQFLFRIEKGVLDINDQGVNDFCSPEDVRVPFRNIVYIGDSDTDIPCMKVVNSRGGHSIGVYNADTKDKTKVYKMMRDERVRYFAAADYTEGSELDHLVKAIICRTAQNEELERIHYVCKKENMDDDKKNTHVKKAKTNAIIALENSRSFATTHTVVRELKKQKIWRKDEREQLYAIALSNSQVACILCDADIRSFYEKLLEKESETSENVRQLKRILDLP